jgi:hypothetical protein
MTVFHIRDHLCKAGERELEEKMRRAVGDSFDVVQAMCNGTKHVAAR